jgi:LacI family transcriptional regulator
MMTVSRVLNGHPDVAPATRESVLSHAEEIGYNIRRPRLVARDRTGLIGVSVPFIRSEGDYFAEILSGAADALEQHEAYLVLCKTRQEHDREAALLQPLLAGRTDGILLIAPSESPTELAALREEGHCFVVIDPPVKLGDDIPSVAAMNTAGARSATEHLIQLGHKRIAVITGPLPWKESIDRLAGYQASLLAAGLPIIPELVVDADFTTRGGELAAGRLLAQPNPPTAIFAFNDNMALGALHVASGNGMRVPYDLSVVGFDDVGIASLTMPALTTVRQPLQDMGRTAVGLLYRLIDGGPIEALHIEVATRLVVRESTGRARDSQAGI